MAEFQLHLNINGDGAIDRLRERFGKSYGNLAYNFAQRVEAGAKAKAPVRTGKLKDSIKRTKIGVGNHKVEVGAYYGIYVNYGTRYMHAQPFWEPAIEAAKVALKKDIEEIFRG